MFRAGKPVALVCHAPGALHHFKTPDGKPLVVWRAGLTEPRCAFERGLAMEAGAPRSAASRWEAAANPWLGCHRTVLAYCIGQNRQIGFFAVAQAPIRSFRADAMKSRICGLVTVVRRNISGVSAAFILVLFGNTWDQEFEPPLLQRGVRNELLIDAAPFAGSASLT